MHVDQVTIHYKSDYVTIHVLSAMHYVLGRYLPISESTIVSEGFKGGTQGAPIMPRDAVSRTANVERTGRHKWVNKYLNFYNIFKTKNNRAVSIREKFHCNPNLAWFGLEFLFCINQDFTVQNRGGIRNKPLPSAPREIFSESSYTKFGF